MADNPTASIAEADAPVTRVCRQCAKTVRLGAEYAGVAVRCPVCKGVLKPSAGEGVRAIEYAERESWLAKTAAWAGSVLFHASLLAAFAGITWMSGFSTGGKEREVGIVTEEEGGAIEAGQADLLRIEGATGSVSALEIQDAAKVEPITDLGPGSSTSEKEAIIGIEMAAGASTAAMKGDWASFAGSGAGQGAGKASFFGIEAEGGRFVFVVDCSSSMAVQGRLEAAKEELMRSIRELEPMTEFYVIFYASDAKPMGGGPVAATEKSKKKCFAWVRSIQPAGGTRPSEAVLRALSFKPDAIWLLSDGGFNHPEYAIKTIREANRTLRIPIHTIAFYDRAAEANARQVAEDSDGTYRFVPGPGLWWGR